MGRPACPVCHNIRPTVDGEPLSGIQYYTRRLGSCRLDMSDTTAVNGDGVVMVMVIAFYSPWIKADIATQEV